ncbi:MAG: hypothetical protein ABI658_10575 [Acidimicrobiales bacterium]
MRTRIAIISAWMLGTVVTSGLAWAAVNRVESGITTRVDTVVSPHDVDRALAPLAVSSTTELANPGATPTTTAPLVVPPTTSPAPTTAEPAAPSAPTTTARSPSTTAAVPPPTIAVTPTSTQPTTTTGATPPTVIPTAGGTIAVSCPTAGTIRLVYATPNAGYTYVPSEITATHIHVKFTKGGQSFEIESECSGGRVESSFEDDD